MNVMLKILFVELLPSTMTIVFSFDLATTCLSFSDGSATSIRMRIPLIVSRDLQSSKQSSNKTTKFVVQTGSRCSRNIF